MSEEARARPRSRMCWLVPLLFTLLGSGSVRGESVTATVSVASEPSGAAVWLKTGRSYEAADCTTPCELTVSFHSQLDVKRLRLRKLGFATVDLEVRPGDRTLHATLDRRAGLPGPSAGIEDAVLRNLNDELAQAFSAQLTDPAPSPLDRLDLDVVRLLVNKEDDVTALSVMVALGSRFGGAELRRAARIRRARDRDATLLRQLTDSAVAAVVSEFRPIAAQLPGIAEIQVVLTQRTVTPSMGEETVPFEQSYTVYGTVTMTTWVRHNLTRSVVTDVEGTRIVFAHIPVDALTDEGDGLAARVFARSRFVIMDDGDKTVSEYQPGDLASP